MYVFVENLKINDKLLKFYFLLGNSIHFVMSVEISRKYDVWFSTKSFCMIFVDCEILLKTKRIDSPMYGLPGIVDTWN